MFFNQHDLCNWKTQKDKTNTKFIKLLRSVISLHFRLDVVKLNTEVYILF